MPAPVIWSGPTLVNTTTDGNQYASSMTALAGGGYVVCWSGQVTPGINSDKTNFQIYDAQGYPVGGEQQVDNSGNVMMPQIAALPGGGFVIAQHVPDAPGSWGIEAQFFDAAGILTAGPIKVSGEDDPMQLAEQHSPCIAVLSNGNLAIAYLYNEPDGSKSVRLQLVDADGNKIGSEIYVADITDGYASDLTIAQTGDGYFALSWTVGFDITRDVALQVFGNDGIAQTGIVPIEGGGAQYEPEIARDGLGNFIVVYGQGASSEHDAQIFSADGTLIKAEFAVSDVAQNQSYSAASKVAGLPGGGFFAAWKEWDGTTSSLVGQVLDASGNKVGPEVLIYTGDPSGETFFPSAIAVLGDGRIVVSLEGIFATGDDTYGASIRTLILDPRDGIIHGTGANDVLLGSIGDVADIFTGYGGDDEIYGLGGNDTIYGDGGDDTIDGGDGDDRMVGGKGDDLYAASGKGDVIIETVNGGTDRILVQGFDYTLAGSLHIEALEAQGDLDTDLTGNEFGQWLKGDASKNKLSGMGGNDTLEGGAGLDHLEGGEGDDYYIIDLQIESIVEELDGGNDTVEAVDISYGIDLLLNFENLVLSGTAASTGHGNLHANKIIGNGSTNELWGLEGNDTIDGMLGADVMHGGFDDDTYFVDDAGDVVDELSSEGIDTVNASIDYTLGADVENLTLNGGATVGTGNSGENALTGNALANILTGLHGNDTLNGMGGADTMEGGERDDLYYVDDAGDVVTELLDEGADAVIASVDYTLTDHVESLTLAAGTKATGNDLFNRITGNGGANLIDGKAGNDTMTGLAGDDTYIVADAGDVVVENAGGGFDTVKAAFDYTLGDNLEGLVLTGAATSGSGNAGANRLTGNAVANILKGGAGNDTINGAAGKDQLWGGTGKDTFDFNSVAEIGKGSGSRDIIRDFKHLTDRIDLKSIDADTAASGNNAFKFVAAEGSKFSGVKGQLTWDQIDKPGAGNDLTLVRGDINGDKVADFTLELTGLVTLTKGDFIL